MSHSSRNLKGGCLYITIAIPPFEPYQPFPADFYPPSLPENFDPTTYETSIIKSQGREEFCWGLYWLDNEHHGTWYVLRPQTFQGPASLFTMYTCDKFINVPPSTLLMDNTIVGLVRVLSIPKPVVAEMSGYFDWLTVQAAHAATRTFLWATTTYLRCRKHIAHQYTGGTDENDGEFVRPFAINAFLKETLAFAYHEVWYGGQLPRPVMVSEFGIELQFLDEERRVEVVSTHGKPNEQEEGFDHRTQARERPECVLDGNASFFVPRTSML